MKSKYGSSCRSFLIFTFICAASIGTAAARPGTAVTRPGTAAAQPGGRLIILRAPNFGWDLAFNLQIDGRSVANVVKYRQYDAWLPAGRHVLTVFKVPYVVYRNPTSITVNIQPGWTYVFTAMWDTNLVYLRPAGALLSPGHIWQQRGDVY